MTQPEPTPKGDRYTNVMLVLATLVALAGIASIVFEWVATPRGIDLIVGNDTLPALYFGNAFGWNALGLGILIFCIWLAVKALKRR